jgi:hypothetical protein
VLADVTGLVDSILGLIGLDPNVTLPPEVCQQLDDLQQRLDPAQGLHLRTAVVRVCPPAGTTAPPPSSGGSSPPPTTAGPLSGLPVPDLGGGG